MKKSTTALVSIFVLTILFCGGIVKAEGLSIGQIEIDRNAWGSRKLYVQADNNADDTVRIRILVQTVYPTHYLSGLERLTVDTTVVLEPKGIADYVIPFEMPGSFGRIVTRAMIHWKYDHFVPEGDIPDSTFQIFNNVFTGKGDALDYSDKRHPIGPVYSVMDHFQMNFEYPRLLLFLLARGETPEPISILFKADTVYTHDLISDLRADGFFPVRKDSLAPGILAITESEGYALKPLEKKATDDFVAWYNDKGRPELKKILTRAGFDDYTGGLPSVQMPLLHTLLMEKWTDPAAGYDVAHFENMEYDLRNLNQPHWIVQGGEFFLPELCLASFDDGGLMYFGTFSPNPKLPFAKATIYDMRAAVEKDSGSIIEVDAGQMRRALEIARDDKLIDKISNAAVEETVSDIESQGLIEDMKSYQQPYLADYIVRLILGGYFVEHRPEAGVDCVKVGY